MKIINQNNTINSSPTDKFLIIISLLSIFGTSIYHLYSLNNIGLFFTCLLSLSTFIILEKWILFNQVTTNQPTSLKTAVFNFNTLIIPSLFYISIFSCFFILLSHQTTDAIVSPWHTIPIYFFFAYALSTLLLILHITKNKTSILPISTFSFLTFSITFFIYKIGYGFDPFIHQSSIKYILDDGFIEPKSPYYIGQYTLVILIHKLTFLKIELIDALLVPALAAILLPTSLKKAFKSLNLKNINLTILALLILPINYLILTTPQSLTYLLTLCIICYGISFSKNNSTKNITILLLLAFSTLTIHPLAGIPATLFTFILITQTKITYLKKSLQAILYSLLALALPTLFLVLNIKNNQISLNTTKSPNASSLLTHPIFPNSENISLNFIYFINNNLNIIILLLAITGLIISTKIKSKLAKHFLFTSIALFIAYSLTSALNFSFLINYERQNYANRIFLISIFFLLPYIAITLNQIITTSLKQNKFIKTTLSIFLSILITTSLYLSYPRKDNFFNSRGYSTSALDIQATKWINSNAKNQNYIVLANQQVSAASLRTFGFKKYHKDSDGNPIFYYPIPTGGPLYQHYLNMVYEKPSKSTMNNAMNLSNVDTAYFVLNKYWWAFEKIKNEATQEADSFKIIGNGDIYIFKYKKDSRINESI